MLVTLRTWQKDDRYVLAELANNINIWNNVRDRLPYPYKVQHAASFIKFYRRQTPSQSLAIEMEGRLVGSVGIELQEDIGRISAELGYWIGEPYWGKGIATEAVGKMIGYAFGNFPQVIRLYAKVFDFNTASMIVLEKNGFHLEAIHRKSAIKNNSIHDEYLWVRFRQDFITQDS